MAETLRDFFTPEAGQRRRSWLNEIDGKISETLGYYLGPQLAPRVEQAANIGALFSPGMDVQDAYTASGEMMAPNRSALDRAGAGAALAGSVAAMFMPGGVSSIRQGIDDLAEAGVRAYDPATTNAFTVWHGSPHDFDRFDMSKIGTGEGAQAYGHGLYFAESPDVATAYRNNLAGRGAVMGGAVDGLPDRWQMEVYQALSKPNGPIRAAAIQDLKSRAPAEYANAIDAALNSQGRLYEVSIDANPEDFLDWDRPLSEQPEGVRDALTGIYQDDMMGGDIARLMASDARDVAIMRGDDAATSLPASQARAAQGMRDLGIPGIRYLDAGSRDAGEGSSNYVVFNDQLLSILNKYGLAGGAVLGAGALAMQPGEAQAQPASVGDILWQQEQAKRLRDYLEAVQ